MIEDNLIAGNHFGVFVGHEVSIGNVIEDNLIGTNKDGEKISGQDYGQDYYGVWISSASDTLVKKNVISGNKEIGVYIAGQDSKNNRLELNTIGLNKMANVALPNGVGVRIDNAPSNFVGPQRNIISGNKDHGVHIVGVEAISNRVRGNYIGLGSDGKQILGNGKSGVLIENAGSKSPNYIGGPGTNDGNVISGNQAGVQIARPGSER